MFFSSPLTGAAALFCGALLAAPAVGHPGTFSSGNHHRRVARHAVEARSGWQAMGCIAHDLPTEAYRFVDSMMTHETCISTCDTLGFPVAGATNGTECWCAIDAPGAQHHSLDPTECDLPCGGNSHETCGDSISPSATVFIKGGAAPFTDAVAPLERRLAAGWSAVQACTIDANNRVLDEFESSLSSNSPDACVSLCSSKGYKLAGVENGNECWCGNSYNVNPVSAPASDCNVPCLGNNGQKCGGPWRVQIYSNGTVPLPQPSLTSGWQLAQACAVDTSQRVLVGASSNPSANTPATCVALCDKLNYKLAGVEYSGECYCANSFNVNPVAAPASDCSASCAGDSGQKCGGTWRITIYSKGSPPSSGSSSGLSAASAASSGSSSGSTSASAAAAVSLPAPASSSSNKFVVAHMIVGNTYSYTTSDWLSNIKRASAVGIDAFALNLGSDSWEMDRVADAYSAASQSGTGFKVFLSLDMTSLGNCGSQNDANTVRGYINQHVNDAAQFKFNGRAVVSAFSGESCSFGTGNVDAGWVSVIRSTSSPVYFLPSFFVDASTLSNYKSTDGDFDWNGGWPQGDTSVSMDETNAHIAGNNGRIMMAAVSPWFFTHYSSKNWIYRGDDWLYNSRWEELLANRNKIDIVQIISWNDFGESHYIGPVAPTQDQPGSTWAEGFDHTPWIDMTAYYAQAFKSGNLPSINKDSVYIWSRPHPASAGASSDSLPQPQGASWTADKLWAVVFSTGSAQLTLTSGSSSQTFSVSAGITKLSIPNAPGTIRATLTRSGNTVVDVAPSSSQFSFATNPQQFNFNAFVAGGSS